MVHRRYRKRIREKGNRKRIRLKDNNCYINIFWGHLKFLFYIGFLYVGGIFNTKISPLALVGYEINMANSALHALLEIYYLISNAHLWNNA